MTKILARQFNVKDISRCGRDGIYVGNEQDYHFKVLFLILKLGFDWASSLYHLSYGMVDLPSGKMKIVKEQ
jgi:arginyl-tRNA synthetase